MWYERSHAKATLAFRYNPLESLWYLIIDLLFSPSLTCISRTLPDVSGDAIQGGKVSLGNLFFDDSKVIFLNHG
jgi:hypothetical protein